MTLFKIRQTLTFSKIIEANSKEEAESFFNEHDADKQYGKFKIKEIKKRHRAANKIIHATELSDETDCGLYITKGMLALDTRLPGSINRVNCKRCLKIAFK